MSKNVLVTGGAGFIGSAVVRQLISSTDHRVMVVDKLTYAGNPDSISAELRNPRCRFEQADIADPARMRALFADFQPEIVMNLAAETHVDRSIDGPSDFVQTNLVGTFVLLQEALDYWRRLGDRQSGFRFHHISTDEVFGSLGAEGYFTEDSPYKPNSPYSASKAGSDHLVRAWQETYGLPVLLTNCSNNYGPCQFPEKLVPLIILNGLEGKPLPVYGTGENVRDWLYVEDHAAALILVAERGEPGASYAIGGSQERRNIDVVRQICRILDAKRPDAKLGARENLITFVQDRPGHDHRYAIDATRIGASLGWKPLETFESGMEKTVEWYLDNSRWWQRVRSGVYRGDRLGLSKAVS